MLVKVADAAESIVIDHQYCPVAKRKREGLKRRFVIAPQGLLSLIGAVVVAKQLRGVLALEGGGELVEELEQLCGGLVGQLGR
jgi:hypothetical protein